MKCHLLLQDMKAVLPVLVKLPNIETLQLVGNSLPANHAQLLLDALPSLDTVDEVARANVLVLDGSQPPPAAELYNSEASALEADSGSAMATESQPTSLEESPRASGFDPTADEMEEFKRRMGIKSNISYGPGGPAGVGRPVSAVRASLSLRSSATSLRPGSAGGRPGSARPTTANGQPVKDTLMYARPASARTGGNRALLTPRDFNAAVGEWLPGSGLSRKVSCCIG